VSGLTIHVPPLRQRREDIPSLAALFLERFASQYRKEVRGLEREVHDLLSNAPWPGNVRQLQNEIERAVALAQNGETIALRHLSEELVSSIARRPVVGQAANGTPASVHAATSANSGSLAEALAASERSIIADRLMQCNRNVSRTAASLKVSRITLQKKMKQYSLRGL
jgi:transcriptional regulator with PAS, ATPase and Fis domain